MQFAHTCECHCERQGALSKKHCSLHRCNGSGVHASTATVLHHAPHFFAFDQQAVLLGAVGEVMLGDLQRSGFQVTNVHEDADVIIVNTCSFIEDAKAESLEVRALACRDACQYAF